MTIECNGKCKKKINEKKINRKNIKTGIAVINLHVDFENRNTFMIYKNIIKNNFVDVAKHPSLKNQDLFFNLQTLNSLSLVSVSTCLPLLNKMHIFSRSTI